MKKILFEHTHKVFKKGNDIMENRTNSSNYFKAKAAGQKINAAIREAHPEYSAKQVYAITKSILAKRYS